MVETSNAFEHAGICYVNSRKTSVKIKIAGETYYAGINDIIALVNGRKENVSIVKLKNPEQPYPSK